MPVRSVPAALVIYGIAGLFGLALALWVFPLPFLFPSGSDMAPFPAGDMAQHVVGQRYFIADAWRWPLLVVPSLGKPGGAHIGLTDSIPLLALLLKLLRSLLPPHFEGIGLWYAIAWTLQPVAAVWCLRAAGETRWLPALCMAVLSVSLPAWWNRFGHAALTAHFLLLVGLGLSFLLLRQGSLRRWAAAAVLLWVTLLVHPYLLVMNAALMASVPLTLSLRRDAAWRRAALGSAVCLGSTAALLWLLGYLGTRGEGGFGRFAMNLLSPVWPAGSWLFGRSLMKVHADNVSGWEGYNYLGAGLLAGLLLVAVLRPKAVVAAVRTHPGLALAAGGLTLLALSNRVAIGFSHVIQLYPAPSFLEALRSSGRFFWPVSYILLLGVVLTLSRLRAAPLRYAVLVGIALLQWVDLTTIRNDLARDLHAPPRPWLVDAAALRPMLAAHKTLVLLPRWECLPPGADQETHQAMLLDLLTLASETTIPVNTMYEARWHRTDTCDLARQAARPLAGGELRVLLPDMPAADRALVPDRAQACRPVGTLLVCARD